MTEDAGLEAVLERFEALLGPSDPAAPQTDPLGMLIRRMDEQARRKAPARLKRRKATKAAKATKKKNRP